MELFKLLGRIIIDNYKAIDALEEITDEAEEASESVDDLGSKSNKAGKTTTSSLSPLPGKFAKVATAAGAVVTSVVAISKTMVEVADGTREYRLEMGKLETAFEVSGHSADAATETYRGLYSVLGETDRSVEASQHLARLCATEEELNQWTDICIGAFATFDDSLPIEGLAEAANETSKTGQLTGVLADALNWAGVSEEDFQAKLDACNTERERTTLITDTMISLYGDAAAAYKENNEDVIAATEAQEKLNEAMARWGEICEPIVTMFREGLAGAINFAADAFEFILDPIDFTAKAMAGTSETSAEAAAKIEELNGQLSALSEIPPALWTPDHRKQQEELLAAIKEAESQYERLAATERQAAEAQSVAVNASNEAAQAVLESAELIPVDAETPVSAMAKVMEGDTSMETAGTETVQRTGSSMQTAVGSAGFDTAGQSAMEKFIQGINSMEGAVMSAVDRIASAAADRMQSALNDMKSTANLHKSEAALTAAEASVWRAGKTIGEETVYEPQKQTSSQSGITIVQNIHAVPQTPVEFAAATEAYFEQARWSMA